MSVLKYSDVRRLIGGGEQNWPSDVDPPNLPQLGEQIKD